MDVKNNLTEGPILQSVLAIALPIILANFLHTAYQLTDTFWVGRLGTSAIAAVSVSFPLIFLIVSLGGGLSVAGTILVAQYKGRNEQKSVDYIAGQTFLIVITVSAVMSCIGYFLAPHLMTLMGAEKDVFVDAVSYMKISFAGMIFMFSFMVFQSLMRGVGDVKVPLYIITGSVLLNLLVDPLFIFGYGFIPGLGVSGAAVATIITQGIGAVIGISMLLSGKRRIHIHPGDLKPDFPLIKKMFFLGIPASVEQSTVAFGMNLLIFLVAGFGTLALAAYGIGHRILGFVIIPTLGLSMATSALVGQNMGAGKIERAERIVKFTSLASFLILTGLGVAIFFLAPKISAVFIPGETETIRVSALFIRIMALTFGFIGIQKVLSGAFIGSGNTLVSMALSIISLWILRFPMAYLLSHRTGLKETGIWISFPVTNILAAAVAAAWFARGTWKRKRITGEIKLVAEATNEVIIEEGVNT